MSTLDADLAAALRPPAPWLGWLMVALCRQRARQSWLEQVYRVHLGDRRREPGEVPGLPGWTFSFHGIGLCLTGPDGELLDVDFHQGGVDVIDPYFFARRLESLRPTPLPEARVLRWLPNGDVLFEALGALASAGHLTRHRGHGVILSRALHAVHARVAALAFDAPDVARAWAAHLGDADVSILDSYRGWLRDRLDQPDVRAGTVSVAASALLRADAIPTLERLAARDITTVTADALDALAKLGAGHAAADALLLRLDPARHHPRVAVSAITLLLAHDRTHADALATLDRFAALDEAPGYTCNPMLDELAVLLLRYRDLPRALPAIGRGLRSRSTLVSANLIALMEALDAPWCRLALAEVGAHEGPADWYADEARAWATEAAAKLR